MIMRYRVIYSLFFALSSLTLFSQQNNNGKIEGATRSIDIDGRSADDMKVDVLKLDKITESVRINNTIILNDTKIGGTLKEENEDIEVKKNPNNSHK